MRVGSETDIRLVRMFGILRLQQITVEMFVHDSLLGFNISRSRLHLVGGCYSRMRPRIVGRIAVFGSYNNLYIA